MKAYLDIETSFSGAITIVGLYRAGDGFYQLVGRGVTAPRLYQLLEGVDRLFTYNGSRFDLPVIHHRLGLLVPACCPCHDLMYDCWAHGLYGGLKGVEVQLGLARATQGLNGWDAMRLWERYTRYQDRQALRTLLRYNRDDVLVLPRLETRLRAGAFRASIWEGERRS